MKVNKILNLLFLMIIPIYSFGMKTIKPELLPNWKTLDFQDSLKVFRLSCHLNEKADHSVFAYSPDSLKKLCVKAKHINDAESKEFFEANFMAYQLTNKRNTLMTAYYSPIFAGRSKPSNRYRYPIYGRPTDLREFRLFNRWHFIGRFEYGFWRAYPSREIIMENGLDAHAKTIAWLKDPLDVLELEIQGTGAIQTPERIIYLNYAAQNGHPYEPIGKFLIADGKIAKDKMSIQAIRGYFKIHPTEIKHYLYQNPSYVFFKESKKNEFYGYKNVILTPGYSLAIDKSMLPMGFPIMIDTVLPNKQRLSRLMVAQDIGGAIKGLHHLDIYLGQGISAQKNAGKMQAKGKYWVLLPK